MKQTIKSSTDFDSRLLREIVALGTVPVAKFETAIRRIMRQKSRNRLWFCNNPSREFDGEKFRDCNFRCCPESRNSKNFFCLQLDTQETGVTVLGGFLSRI